MTWRQGAAVVASLCAAAVLIERSLDAQDTTLARKLAMADSRSACKSAHGACEEPVRAAEAGLELAPTAQPGGIDPMGMSRAIRIAFEDCP